jgi:hypothetical protein
MTLGGVQNPSTIIQNTTLGTSGGLSKVVQKKGGTVFEERVPFWRRLADFGCHFGPAGSRRESQNRGFGHHVRKITKKGCPKTRLEKTLIFYRKLVPK